jgi:hypothetical protein
MRETPLDNQQLFDRVFDGLKSQGFQLSTAHIPNRGHDMCAYRGAEERRCAAGWAIPDFAYDPEMEGAGIATINEVYRLGFTPDQLTLLSIMQRAHDNALSPAKMQQAMRHIAVEWNLKVPDATKVATAPFHRPHGPYDEEATLAGLVDKLEAEMIGKFFLDKAYPKQAHWVSLNMPKLRPSKQHAKLVPA